MAFLDISYIASVIMNFLIILLLIAIYTYIVNLENKGCVCAKSGDSAFIKGFSLFAIIYILVIMFIPHKVVVKFLGPVGSYLLGLIHLFFILVSIYFWWVTFRYTRYLVNEKCKCSEDMRREIIMIGSMIELILIFFIFILGLLFAIIFNIIVTTFNYIGKHDNELDQAIKDPVRSISKLPNKVRSSLSDASKIVKNTTSKFNTLVTKNKKKSS